MISIKRETWMLSLWWNNHTVKPWAGITRTFDGNGFLAWIGPLNFGGFIIPKGERNKPVGGFISSKEERDNP